MIKDEAIHFSLSILTGAVIWFMTRNLWTFPLALASGFFIDVDHLFDYLLFSKFRHFGLKEFFSGQYFDYSGKVILPLHGFEWALLLILTGFIFNNFSYVFWSLGFSMILHLGYDTAFNRPKWPTYFFFFRLYHHFKHNKFGFPYHPEGKK